MIDPSVTPVEVDPNEGSPSRWSLSSDFLRQHALSLLGGLALLGAFLVLISGSPHIPTGSQHWIGVFLLAISLVLFFMPLIVEAVEYYPDLQISLGFFSGPVKSIPRPAFALTLSIALVLLIHTIHVDTFVHSFFAVSPLVLKNPARSTNYETIEMLVSQHVDLLANSVNRSSGGVHTMLADVTSPTQAWTTAQAVTAVCASGKYGSHSDLVDEAVQYLQTVRQGGEFPGYPFEDFIYRDGTHSPDSSSFISSWVLIAQCRQLPEYSKHLDRHQIDKANVLRLERESATRIAIANEVELLLKSYVDSTGWVVFDPGTISEDDRADVRAYASIMAVWALAEVVGLASSYEPLDGTPMVSEEALTDIRKVLVEAIDLITSSLYIRQGMIVSSVGKSDQHAHYALGLDAQTIAILYLVEELSEIPFPRNGPFLSVVDRLLEASALAARDVRVDDEMGDGEITTRSSIRPGQVMESVDYVWFPWTFLACEELQRDPLMSARIPLLRRARTSLGRSGGDCSCFAQGGTYRTAEFVFCMGTILELAAPGSR